MDFALVKVALIQAVEFNIKDFIFFRCDRFGSKIGGGVPFIILERKQS